MKSNFACLILALAPVLMGCSHVDPLKERPVNRRYCNPLDVPVADPFVYEEGGVYYLMGTTDLNAHDGFQVFTSTDLVHWASRGYALKKTASSWAQSSFWGPEIVRHKGEYYLFFAASPNPKGAGPPKMRICMAKGPGPLGPFSEVRAPLFDPPGTDAWIDQNIFVDEDGQAYIYLTRVTMGRNEIQVAPMKDDLSGFSGERRTILVPDQEWDSRPWRDGHRIVEGAWMLKRKGLYYLLYTGNGFTDPNYAIGYAVSKHPLGPFTKFYGNPILHKIDTVAGPGNGMIVPSPDGTEHFMVYHVHRGNSSPLPRFLAIDRVRFAHHAGQPDRIVVEGPTSTPQPLPSGAKLWPVASSDDFRSPELRRPPWMIVNEQPGLWRIAGGVLRITTTPGDLRIHRAKFQNLFLQYAPEGDCQASVQVGFPSNGTLGQAFLTIYRDHNNNLRLSLTSGEAGKRKLVFSQEENGEYKELETRELIQPGNVRLRLRGTGNRYSAAYREDGGDWTELGSRAAAYPLPRIGLGAVAPANSDSSTAEFRDFSIQR